MRFTYKEFYLRSIKSGCTDADFNDEIKENAFELIRRINALCFEPPMYFSSCLRSKSVHERIYKEKGVPADKIPWGSKHLYGKAVDVAGPKNILKDFLSKNVDKLEWNELWCEDFASTPGWVHFQSEPPKSGKRFFKP
jgi:hypothetical protein